MVAVTDAGVSEVKCLKVICGGECTRYDWRRTQRVAVKKSKWQ